MLRVTSSTLWIFTEELSWTLLIITYLINILRLTSPMKKILEMALRMIVPLVYTLGKMTKNILAAVFFSVITYAIVSSIGQPQHTYPGANHSIVVDKDLP